MTWGARSQVPKAAVILLFQVLPQYAAATRLNSPTGSTSTYAAAELTDRGKRESGSMSDIFIEHDKDGDPRVFPMLVGLTIVGGLIAVTMMLLACHLLLRLAESQCCKCRYQRLRREDSDTGRRLGKKRAQGQSFTYVDMSYNECAHLDHDGEEREAPRFAVALDEARKIDSDSAPLRRGQGPATESAASVSTARAEDSAKSIAATSATSHLDEPPKKKICAQHIGCLPGSRIGGQERYNEYEERCAQYKSSAPEFEINIRDRLIRTCPHGGTLSPRGIRAEHTEAGVVPGVGSETNQGYYRDGDSTHWHRHARIWNSNSSPPQNLHGTTSPSLSLGAINPPPPGDSTSRKTSSRGQQGSSMSGHGRYYEEHAHGEIDRRDVTSASKFISSPDVDHESTMQGWPTAVLSSSSREPTYTANELVELPESRVREYRNPSASSLKSVKHRKFVQDDVSMAGKTAAQAEKEHKESSTPGSPIQLDMTLALAGLPSPPSSASGTPRASGINEMRVKVPKIIAYFDRPQNVQRLNAKFDGSAKGSVQNSPQFAEIPSKDATKKISASLPSPRKTLRTAEMVKLPEPPIDQSQKESEAEPSSERSAKTINSSDSERKQHDVHDSTEPFSVDEASQQRTSGSELLSATDMSAGQVNVASFPTEPTVVDSSSKSSLAIIHAQPSTEAPSVAHVKRSVSLFAQSNPRVAESKSNPPKNDPDSDSTKHSRNAQVPDLPSKQTIGVPCGPPLPTTNESLEVNLNTMEANARMEANGLKQSAKGHSFHQPERWTRLHNRNDALKAEKAVSSDPSHPTECNTLETEGAGQPVISNNQPSSVSEKDEPSSLETSKIKSSFAEKPIIAEKPQLLYNARSGEELKAVNSSATPGLGGKAVEALFTPSPPRAPAIRNVPRKMTLQGPDSNLQNRETTAFGIMEEHKVLEENHAGPFNDSNRRVSASSAMLKRVGARFNSSNRRRSLDYSTSSEHPDKLLGPLSHSSSLRHLGSTHSLPPSTGSSLLSRDDFIDTHSMTTFLPDPLFLDKDEDSAKHNVGLSEHVQPGAISKVDATQSTTVSPNDKVPAELVQNDIATLSSSVQSLTSSAPQQPRDLINAARYVSQDPDAITELPHNERALLDSSVKYLRRRNTDFDGELQHQSGNNEPTNSVVTLGSPNRKIVEDLRQREVTVGAVNKDRFLQLEGPEESKTIRSRWPSKWSPVERVHREIAPSERQHGEIMSLTSDPVVAHGESISLVDVNGDQRALATFKPRESRLASFPSNSSELINRPEVSAVQPAVASGTLVTNDGLAASSKITSTSTVMRTEDSDKGTSVEPYSDHRVASDAGKASRTVATGSENRPTDRPEGSAGQPAVASGTLVTNDGLAASSKIASTSTVLRTEELDKDTSVEPYSDHRVASDAGEASRTVATGNENRPTDRPEVSAVPSAVASGTLVTNDGLVASREITSTSTVMRTEESDKDTYVAPYSDHRVTSDAGEALRTVATGSESWLIDRSEGSAVQPAVVSGTLETNDGLVASREITPTSTVMRTEESDKDTFVEPYSDHRVASDAGKASRTVATGGENRPTDRPEGSAVQPAVASGTLVTNDGLVAAREITSTSTVMRTEEPDKDTSVAPYSDHRVTSDAGEASRTVATGSESCLTDRPEVFAVQPDVASVTLPSNRLIAASDIKATSAMTPTERSDRSMVAPYSDHRAPSEVDIARKASRTLATRGQYGLPIELKDDTTAVARAVIPSRRSENMSVEPHRKPFLPSDITSSQVSTKEEIASPAVFVERTSLLPAHISKDLTTSQPDQTKYKRIESTREKRADAENPKAYKARASNDEPFTK